MDISAKKNRKKQMNSDKMFIEFEWNFYKWKLDRTVLLLILFEMGRFVIETFDRCEILLTISGNFFNVFPQSIEEIQSMMIFR